MEIKPTELYLTIPEVNLLEALVMYKENLTATVFEKTIELVEMNYKDSFQKTTFEMKKDLIHYRVNRGDYQSIDITL